MSVFKKLSKADVTTVLYSANKQWDLPYTCFSNNPYFNIYKGTYITGTFVSDDASVDPVTNGEYERLIYDSMNHMFYQSYNGRALNTGSLMFNVNTYESASQQRPTQSYFDYNVNPRLIKNFPTGPGAGIRLLSIEQDIYGSKVLPYSFKLTSSVYFIVDDGNGNLYDVSKNLTSGYISGSYFNAESYFLTYDPAWNTHVGNIFYAHGLATITEPDYQLMFPLPPLAYNDSASFLDTDSPKTITILANDVARSCAIDTGSVVISGSNSPYYTVNANGTLTLNTTTVGSYNIYYTVNGLCNSGCSMTSNQAKVIVDVLAPTTTSTTTTTTTAPTTTTSTTTTTTTAPTTTTSTTTSTTTAPTTTTSTTTSTTTIPFIATAYIDLQFPPYSSWNAITYVNPATPTQDQLVWVVTAQGFVDNACSTPLSSGGVTLTQNAGQSSVNNTLGFSSDGDSAKILTLSVNGQNITSSPQDIIVNSHKYTIQVSFSGGGFARCFTV